MTEVLKAIRKRIPEPVGHDSDECALWLTTHSSCKGCEFNLGCVKLAAAGTILSTCSMFSKDIDVLAIMKLAKVSASVVRAVTKAKTEDEVKEITLTFLDLFG